MLAEIESFIQSKKIAVVGVSSVKNKIGYAVYRTLKERGYEVFPVHPDGHIIDGNPCYRSLSELPPGVNAAVIAVKPKKVSNIVDAAIAAGIKRIWFQQGSDFHMAAEQAKKAGLEVVSRKCILLYAPPVTGIHKVHQFLARLFGRL
jgi:predicted CoA-binding protein